MNSTKIFSGLAITIFATLNGSCSSKSTPSPAGSAPTAPSSCTTATQGASGSVLTTSTTNVIPLYIADPATTGSIGYSNEPLVSVTICSPNHGSDPSKCQTISNILLDTGSYGLRVFSSVIAGNVSLAQQTISYQGETLKLAECMEFGTGADWGPIQNADVVLGNQTATNIPIQVIDSTFGSMPQECAALSPDTNPCSPDAGFNGILGVGVFAQDCGDDCATTDSTLYIGQYLGCNSTQCFNAGQDGTVMPVPLPQQVVNPVAALSSNNFNNGISIHLPAIGPSGATSVSGSMTIGIGAAASNSPSGSVGVYPADPYGTTDGMGANFLTIFNGDTFGTTTSSGQAFLDSGSNAFYIPTASGLSLCPDTADFFCPSSAQNLSATALGFSGTTGAPGTPSVVVNFSIANTDALSNTGNSAFNNIGGPAGAIAGFDWGLPFFFGRTVYVGIQDKQATINSATKTGPYWAF